MSPRTNDAHCFQAYLRKYNKTVTHIYQHLKDNILDIYDPLWDMLNPVYLKSNAGGDDQSIHSDFLDKSDRFTLVKVEICYLLDYENLLFQIRCLELNFELLLDLHHSPDLLDESGGNHSTLESFLS